MSLVLDWVDGSLGSPVDGGGEVGGIEDLDGGGGGLSLVSEESLVFVLGPGGELVVSDGEGVVLVSVDLLVLGVLLVEEGESEGVLLLGSVGDTVFGEVLDESLLDDGVDGGGVVTHVDSEESSGGAEGVHL